MTDFVLVTGSSGLLGTRICEALADSHEVIGCDLHPPEAAGETVETAAEDQWVGCDLTDDDSVARAIEEVGRRCDGTLASVVHLAAHYDFSGADSPLYEALTVGGTRRLLRALRSHGIETGQFVFASSVLAMRPAEDGGLLDESSPEGAEWPYPQSKLAAEAVLREERGDIPAVVLRIAGCYDEQCHSIPIAQQIHRIHRKQLKSLFFPGDSSRGQSFVHVDDVADLVARVIARRDALTDHEVFVVGEPAWLSYEQLQERIGELLHGRAWATIRIPAPLAKAGAWVEEKAGRATFIKPWMIDLADAHYPLDISRARDVLAWEPRHRLRDVLPAMTAALAEDPDAWYRANRLSPDEGDDAEDDDDPAPSPSQASGDSGDANRNANTASRTNTSSSRSSSEA